jgi:hypothetical protein
LKRKVVIRGLLIKAANIFFLFLPNQLQTKLTSLLSVVRTVGHEVQLSCGLVLGGVAGEGEAPRPGGASGGCHQKQAHQQATHLQVVGRKTEFGRKMLNFSKWVASKIHYVSRKNILC